MSWGRSHARGCVRASRRGEADRSGDAGRRVVRGGGGRRSPAWAFTGVNGKIAYVGGGKVRTDTSDIWMADKDGAGRPRPRRRERSRRRGSSNQVGILYVAGKKGGPGDIYDDLITSKRGPTNLTNTSDQFKAETPRTRPAAAGSRSPADHGRTERPARRTSG